MLKQGFTNYLTVKSATIGAPFNRFQSIIDNRLFAVFIIEYYALNVKGKLLFMLINWLIFLV